MAKIKEPISPCADTQYFSSSAHKRDFWRRIYESVHDTLFPPHIKCIICGDDLPTTRQIEICDACLPRFEYIAQDRCCQHCGAPVYGEAKYCFNCKDNDRHFDEGRSVFVYAGAIESLVSGLKFGNKPYLARTLGAYLAQLYREKDWQVDFVVPVPMTPGRIKERGYNQAALLATAFCQNTNLPLRLDVLVKTKDTSQQKELSMRERQENIRDAFAVSDKKVVRQQSVLIIDDVMTTGATASACALALKKAHAQKVYVITLAHGKTKIATQDNLENIKSVINSVK